MTEKSDSITSCLASDVARARASDTTDWTSVLNLTQSAADKAAEKDDAYLADDRAWSMLHAQMVGKQPMVMLLDPDVKRYVDSLQNAPIVVNDLLRAYMQEQGSLR